MAVTECSTGYRPTAALRLVARCFDFLMLRARWQSRRRYRRDLERLLRVGPHMLADIGLTLDEARREAAKPFWCA